MLATPNYINATYKAHRLLLDKNILTLPIDIFALINSFDNIRLYPYGKLATDTNTPIEVINYYFGKDGAVVREITTETSQVRYTIFYNSNKDTGTVRYILAHEFGHIFLRHFDVLGEKKFCFSEGFDEDGKYDLVEQETECFVRNLLSPLFYKEHYSDADKVAELTNLPLKVALKRHLYLPRDILNYRLATRTVL